MRPLRNILARVSLGRFVISASAMSVCPASTKTSVVDDPVPFRAWPHFRVELTLDLNEPPEITAGRNQLNEPPQLLDRAVDGDRADPVFQFGHIGFHIFRGDLRPRGRIHVEPTRPRQEVEEEAIALR